MSTSKPIKSFDDVQKFKNYYLEKEAYRNYMLVSVGLNSALRISDMLQLKWSDFYNFETKSFKTHLELTEKKTDKYNQIFINPCMLEAVKLYIAKSDTCKIAPNKYLFTGNNGNPLTRMQAYRIIKEGGASIGLKVSCHSLRKTFGYHAWKKGTPPVILMQIYNHSNYEVTKRYLGISQEDKDRVYSEMML
jgi:integrase